MLAASDNKVYLDGMQSCWTIFFENETMEEIRGTTKNRLEPYLYYVAINLNTDEHIADVGYRSLGCKSIEAGSRNIAKERIGNNFTYVEEKVDFTA